jgi:hypothetical protein
MLTLHVLSKPLLPLLLLPVVEELHKQLLLRKLHGIIVIHTHAALSLSLLLGTLHYVF